MRAIWIPHPPANIPRPAGPDPPGITRPQPAALTTGPRVTGIRILIPARLTPPLAKPYGGGYQTVLLERTGED